jgi:hypothetical protein
MSEPERQRQAEIQALARLAGDELGGAIEGIAAVHRAVSESADRSSLAAWDGVSGRAAR